MMDADAPPPRRLWGPGVRLLMIQAICQRIAEGEPLVAILATPGMPPNRSFRSWLKADPDLAELYQAAQLRRPSSKRVETKRRRRYTPELGAELCERLCEAQGLEVVCAAPDMPSQAAVYQWLRRYPDFAEQFGRARQIQADRLFDQVWTIARHAHEGNWRSAKLKTDTLRWLVGKLAPDRYGAPPGAARDEEARPIINVEVVRFSDAPPMGPNGTPPVGSKWTFD
jgi:hypothetical protein